MEKKNKEQTQDFGQDDNKEILWVVLFGVAAFILLAAISYFVK